MVAAAQRGVVLEPEAGAAGHAEVAGLAAQRPQDVAGGAVELVDRRRVARRDEHAAAGERLDRVDVEGVVEGAVGRRGVGVAQRDVAERVPLPGHEAGAHVDLLHDRVDERGQRARRRAGQVHQHRRVDGEQRVALGREAELVDVHRVAVAGVHDVQRAVAGVGDHALAEAVGGHGHRALPPGQDRLARVVLDAQVAGDLGKLELVEPDHVALAVDDHRAARAHRREGHRLGRAGVHDRRGQRREEDPVAEAGGVLEHGDAWRGEAGLGGEVLELVGLDLGGAQQRRVRAQAGDGEREAVG